MSFAAEPYGTFVQDLLANLTGGVSRVRFRYVDEELPFRLAEHERVQPETLRVHGLANGDFISFLAGRDFDLAEDGTLAWREASPGVAAAGATLPDAGTDVWVAFDHSSGPAPLINDRNPGSVVRTLAEAFAREYAVMSMQLDGIYQAAFVETAGGRDLDAIAALVGLSRRGSTHARGEIVLHRPSPAPADIVVVAGTLISTPTPPIVTVETTLTVTLRRGTVSVAAPIQAMNPGPSGVAPARALTVLHRPIFGIDNVLNPEPMTFGGGSESDDELRARVVRALENAGRSTVGAIKGALGAIEGIREQDILVEEDHLSAPGLVKVHVAANISQETALVAVAALEATRPAGVRIAHNLVVPTPVPVTLATETGGGGDLTVAPAPPLGVSGDVFVPLEAMLTVTPADSGLTQDRKDALALAAEDAIRAAIDNIGVGEAIVYNRLISSVMAVEGVLDAVLEIGYAGAPLSRSNIRLPNPGTRPTLAEDMLVVRLRGERVVIDLDVVVERRGLAASAEAPAALAAIRSDIETRLAVEFLLTPAELSTSVLSGALSPTEDYLVESLSYRVELLDEGLRIARQDAVITLDEGQQIWVRSVGVSELTVTG